MTAPPTAGDIEILERIQRRVLWLAAWMVHHANHHRPDPEGIKVGGHQASSASLVSILTALYFKALQPGDVVALKAHAAPAFYAIQYLRGRLPVQALRTLRAFGGLQAYPSRRKNPEVVDLSTGSMGLGAVAASFGALTARYLEDHGGRRVPERFVVLVGDAELDEGNVWEALLEEALARQDRLLWIVDLNRQSLDRITPDGRREQLAGMFRAAGWRVIQCRWGARLARLFEAPGGGALRRRLEAMPQAEYQALLRLAPGAVRKALVADGPGGAPVGEVKALLAPLPDEALPGLLTDLGGHDLAAVLGALEAAREHPGPAVILADTVKGWGLPMAGDPLNHGALMTPAQIEALRERLGVAPGQEWAGFPPGSAEARWIAALPPLFRPPAPAGRVIEIPERLGEAWAGRLSTQEAFGRALGALARLPAGDCVVTVSADVAVTTHLAAWINRRGVYFPEARPDFFASLPQPLRWQQSPAGQHIELGIAEHNLFLLLGALGLSHELSGQTLLPVGTLYDPFVCRGLDALYHALYAGGRFVVVATPSGVSLAPEGGAHQSVVTPPLGVALPDLRYAEPAFAQEVEWLLLDGLRRVAHREESLYLRLSTRPLDQSLAPPGSPALREAVLRGGYRLVDGRELPGWSPEGAVHLFAMGVTVPGAVEAARRLAEEGVAASVFVVTSPDLLYRGMRERRPWLLDLVSAEEEEVPAVSVLDGHSQTLAFLGSALGVPQLPLGVDHFGQSGALGDLYRHYGLDAGAIAGAARILLGRGPGTAS